MDLCDLPPLVDGENNTPACVGDAENNEATLNQKGSDVDDSESDDEEIDNELGEQTVCLFCDHASPTIQAAIKHVETDHHLSLSHMKVKFHMDQYSFLKLINCIRREKISAEKVKNTPSIFWSDEKYLQPLQYEPWLTFDYESLPNLPHEDTQQSPNLESIIVSLQEQLQEKNKLLEQAHEDIKKMRAGFQRLFAEKEDAGSSKTHVNCVSNMSLTADTGYFSSYAHFGIHHEMLSDVVRTTSYRDALLKNKSFINGKDVLDVGSGTSVLSIFASQAGAKNVVGVDNSDIIYNAMDIVKINKINNVQLVKGRLEDTQLPQQKYDIIISEWMGYFLLFEGMLDSIIYARNNHLKDNGILLPNRCTMSIVGYGNENLYKQHVTFWDNVYGLNMSNMRQEVMHEPLIEIVDPKYILSEHNIIADLNMATVDLNYSNFSYELNLKCMKDGFLSAFVGYFDTYFELPCESVHFGTGPNDKPTHWKQVVFFLKEQHKISAGEVIQGKLTCRRSKNSARSLDIDIEVFNQLHTYYLD